MSDPISEFNSILKESKFIFVVFYRGHWCPFCMAYLRVLRELDSRVTAAGGTIVSVTSEAASELPATRSASGYNGKVIVDAQNTLAQHLRDRNLLNVAISDMKKYPNGMAQPAILVLENGAESPIYRWEIMPSLMNMGGAKDRPNLNQVWDNVEAKLNKKAPVHEKISHWGAVSVLRQKLFG